MVEDHQEWAGWARNEAKSGSFRRCLKLFEDSHGCNM